jgi:hypothetical protein
MATKKVKANPPAPKSKVMPEGAQPYTGGPARTVAGTGTKTPSPSKPAGSVVKKKPIHAATPSKPAAAKPNKPAAAKPKKPTLAKLARSKDPKVRRAATQALSGSIALHSGVNSIGSKPGKPRKTREVTDRDGNVVGTVQQELGKGEVAYGGRVYSRDSLDSLVKDIRSKGGNAANYVQKAAGALGLSEKETSAYIKNLAQQRKARKLAKASGRY